MLSQLQISNYVIVESLDLEFDGGMSVLSGETGAGKSILLGALGLVLGDRADSAHVLPGHTRAEIAASFMIDGCPSLKAWLEENELEADNECILRRTVSSDGRSRGYINGQPVPLTSLKSVGEQLVELHGQHAHHSLLKSDAQRIMLDNYAGHQDEVDQISEIYKRRKALKQQLNQLLEQQRESTELETLLGFQIEELEQLNLTEGEWEHLEQEHSRTANIQTLKKGCQQLQALLGDEDEESILSQLNRAQRELSSLIQLDSSLTSSNTMLEEASIQIHETLTEVRHYLDSLDSDPERLAQLEERISSAYNLARKHRIQPAQLPEHLNTLNHRLKAIGDTDQQIADISKELDDLNSRYQTLSQKISMQRKAAAQRLDVEVTKNMHQLGIGEGEFTIAFDEGSECSHGMDDIQFMIKTNPGQPFRPLAKIASGGELSRISLSIQVILATRSGVPTLIFDEVDVGIGGKTADKVGRALRQLGQSCQVICVTHQPQVAAQANHHFQITKQSTDAQSRTQVIKLDPEARVHEIARMSSGIEITEQTLNHAREMINSV